MKIRVKATVENIKSLMLYSKGMQKKQYVDQSKGFFSFVLFMISFSAFGNEHHVLPEIVHPMCMLKLLP